MENANKLIVSVDYIHQFQVNAVLAMMDTNTILLPRSVKLIQVQE